MLIWVCVFIYCWFEDVCVYHTVLTSTNLNVWATHSTTTSSNKEVGIPIESEIKYNVKCYWNK